MVPVHPGPFPFLTNILFNPCMQKTLHHFFTSAANSQLVSPIKYYSQTRCAPGMYGP